MINLRLIFPLICLSLLAACKDDNATTAIDYTRTGTPAYGDTLVSAQLGDATSLLPMLAGEAAASAIAANIYNSLLKYDKNLNIVGDLADSWTINPEGTQITFYIKKGVTFSDGKPLTAHDVLATFNAITNPNTRTPYASDYQLVQNAEVVNDHTFRVTYPEPYAPALASWVSLNILPKHIIELDEDFNNTRLKEHPIGTGPYILKSWQRGQETVLEANPHYFEGKPYIERLRYRVIPDQDTQFLELKSGNLDTMGLKPLQYARLTNKPAFTNQFNKYAFLGFQYTYVGFNLKRPLFQDIRLRQALSYATPREDIIKGVLFGLGEPIVSIFKPGTWAHNDNLLPYAYNPDTAKALLAEAGWADTNNDGLLDKNGETLSFTLVTNQGNDTRIKTAEILQQAWRNIGVDLKIRVQEWSTFIENTIHTRSFDAILLGWSLTPEPDPYDIWHSSKTAPREFNMIGYNNPRVDELIVKAQRAFVQETRKAYLDEIQAILHEEQPYLWLYAPTSLVALHKRFKNIEPAPAGLGHNSTQWYVPQDQQKYVTTLTP